MGLAFSASVFFLFFFTYASIFRLGFFSVGFQLVVNRSTFSLGCGAAAGHLPGVGAGAQIKNQEPEPEVSLKFTTGAAATTIWEVSPWPFLDTNSFFK